VVELELDTWERASEKTEEVEEEAEEERETAYGWLFVVALPRE
jgi:hypothetical protein